MGKKLSLITLIIKTLITLKMAAKGKISYEYIKLHEVKPSPASTAINQLNT